jgi:hypothetical protein
MKRILFMAFLGMMLSMPSFAQNNTRISRGGHNYNANRYNLNHWTNNDLGVYYGLRLGLGISTVNSDDAKLDGGDAQSGLNVGFVAGMQLSYSTPLFLEGGLYYTEKGGKGTYSDKKFTYDLNYLELPVVVKYQYFVDNDVAIQPFFGGYVACGVSGRIKNFGDRQAESSFSSDSFQRFDGGLRLGCGLSYQSLYMDLTYDLGLANICHDYFDTSHNRCFYINIGVNF